MKDRSGPPYVPTSPKASTFAEATVDETTGERVLQMIKRIDKRAWVLAFSAILLFSGRLELRAGPTAPAASTAPPPGFIALFNGRDLTGWHGGETFDPRKLLAMPAAERAAQIARWTASMKEHWTVEKGELVSDGQGAYATTEKDYGDFELLTEYKTVPKADSGIYLRGSPLVLADKPFGQWNCVRVIMVGARVSVWLNDKLVVDSSMLENYFDRKTPVPPAGPIQLQTHGGEVRWRNLFLRRIGADEANRLLASHANEGFQSVFNGRDFTGWAGPTNEYEVIDGAIQCRPHKGGTIYTTAEYGDFAARLEIKLPPGGNNGLAIRYPGQGDTAYLGMCESQVLDDNYEKATGETIDPRQAHGSAYGMVAAARGYQHTIGEWNFEEVVVKGSTIKVELNGTVILDCDLSTVTEFMANHPHPGKDRTSGYFGFAGHNDPVAFRNIRIKRL